MAAPKGNKYNKGNHDTGRPSKFKSSYTEAIIKFFDIEPYKKEIMEKSKEYFKDGQLKKESEKIKHMPNKMPTLYRFARKIGVEYSTVWRWAEKGEWDGKDKDGKETTIDKNFKDFCNSYKAAKEIQKEFLITIGLAGAAPAPFAIFTAKNVTDMRDKQEQEVTHKGSIIYLPPKK